MNYKRCDECGAYLDFNEKCTCREERHITEQKWKSMTKADRDGQIRLLPNTITTEGDYINE